MAEIKSLSQIREKWSRVTPMRTEDYKKGVENPRRDWAEETAAASGNWKQGVDQAASKDMFKKGVQAAGSSKWRKGAAEKGVNRFAEGVMLGTSAYEKGFAPFHDAIESADLGPRFPRRDPRNLQRVKAVNDALVAVKTA